MAQNRGGLPQTVFPPTEPIGYANGVPVIPTQNQWLLQYNIAQNSIGIAGQASPPQAVSVSASPFSFQASTSGQLLLAGGLVTKVTFTRGTVQLVIGLAAAQLLWLTKGDIATITYSAKPVATFIPNG